MAVAMTGAAIALVVLLRASMLRGVDSRARLRLQDVAGLTQRGALPTTLAGTDEDGTVAQLVVNGRVVAQSAVVEGSAPLAHFVPPEGRVFVRSVHHPPIRGGAPTFRVAAKRVDTPQGPGVVYVAASVEPVTDSINTLEVLLAIVVPGLLVLVGATMWRLVGSTLDPVEAIREQVAEISATELGRRVPEPDTADEIQRLAQTMNSMLGRLDEATSRQRSFVADAAHELRSPLASMRAELDVAAAHPEAADWRALVARLSTSSRRMGRLVEDLLVLATAEESGARRNNEVDLDDVVLGQLEALRTTTALRLDVDGLAPARVWGDRDQLERVVANLLDNAEHYATTTIAVELRHDDGEAELVVADDGPGIPPEHRRRIFDRFTRVDAARDRRAGGAGLGLAIARRIIERHGGSISVADAPRGTRIVVRLPVGMNNGSTGKKAAT
jgi:signal transduction histidine kinase